jgi:hypothetical protein
MKNTIIAKKSAQSSAFRAEEGALCTFASNGRANVIRVLPAEEFLHHP